MGILPACFIRFPRARTNTHAFLSQSAFVPDVAFKQSGDALATSAE
jgi:hypothetical protein